MKYVPQERRKGPSGPALVTVISNTVQFQFLNEWGTPDGRIYQFLNTTLPSINFQDGTYFVSISAEGDRLYGIRPLNGSYIARFSRIIAKDGQLPAPKRFQGNRTKRDGSTYPVDELTFSVLAVIESGLNKGMELVFPFLYARSGSGFMDDGQGGLMYKGGGNKGEQLVQFLEAAGIWNKNLPFSDNVLPMLEAELKQVNKPFMVVMRDGWPQSFSDVPDFGQAVNGHQPKEPIPDAEPEPIMEGIEIDEPLSLEPISVQPMTVKLTPPKRKPIVAAKPSSRSSSKTTSKKVARKK